VTGAGPGHPTAASEEGAMTLIRRGRWVAGLILILILGRAAPTGAQGLPPALPPLPEGPVVRAVAPSPVIRPRPPVVAVPPGGYGSTWAPGPIDPIALERHEPGHVDRKARSHRWRRLQGKLWGYPEEYEPRVLGAALYDNARVMVANGAAARMVLYQYDFLPGSAELSPRGLDQLAKLSAQMAAAPFPLLVERTPGDPALAESRRSAVLARLAQGPRPVASDRVLVGVPAAHGMSGPDAQVVAGNALSRTQQYGPPIPINSNGVNSPSGVTSGSAAAANGGINP